MFNNFPATRPYFLLLLLGLFIEAAGTPPSPRPTKSREAGISRADEAGTPTQAGFDSVSIHKLYMDGEFETGIRILEQAIREKRDFTHADSVFFCKHLGVMYTATYETREKGKLYMRKLVMLEPTATILDMYASDMIYMIFKNIKDEIDQTRMRVSAGPAETASARDSKGSKGHTWIWAGAGAALVVGGAVAYFILNEEPEDRHLDASFPNETP